MPFSIVLNGFPKDNVPVPHIQGSALQGMFLHLMGQVDPSVSTRLHDNRSYRPYTLSPLGIGERGRQFRGFQLPRERMLKTGTPCYLRITFLEDELFPTFSRYFLDDVEPTFLLGETEFIVTDVVCGSNQYGEHKQARSLRSLEMRWGQYLSYTELIERASQKNRKITLHFLTPTSFRRGDVDFPLPDPRLVFRSYRKRFEEFYCNHIRKILLSQGGTRYLAKANYNISRMKYLSKLYPEARFVILVRDPPEHIASLIKQHRLF